MSKGKKSYTNDHSENIGTKRTEGGKAEENLNKKQRRKDINE